MKVTLQQTDTGNEEVIIRYRKMTRQIEEIVQYLEGKAEKLVVTDNGQHIIISRRYAKELRRILKGEER